MAVYSTRLTPEEPILGTQGLTTGDFWSWAYSDLLTNTVRSLLAEFIVASALQETHGVRTEWDSVDVRYRNRLIEVKSSAYVQTWDQARPSQIRFDIAPKQAWDARSGTYSAVPIRSANLYVFCLYLETDKQMANQHVRDMSYWEFYPVPTAWLDRDHPGQQSLALSGIRSFVGCTYDELRRRVDALIDEIGEPPANSSP